MRAETMSEKEEEKYKMAKDDYVMYNNYSGEKKDIIQTKSNFSIDKCEDLCANDLNCLSFNYDRNTSTCATSKTILNPIRSDNSNIIGVKKNALSKKGVYNFYQKICFPDLHRTFRNKQGCLRIYV